MKAYTKQIWNIAKGISWVSASLFAIWSLVFWLISILNRHWHLHPSLYALQLINSFLGFFIFGCIMMVVGLLMQSRRAAFFQPLVEVMRRIAKGDFNVKVDMEKWEGNRFEQFGPIVESINDMATELHQLERMRQEFISNVSHEIQTPLTSIGGFARALKHDHLSVEERDHYLAIIEQECGRLSKLSDNLLKLTSLESEHPPFDVKPFRLDRQLNTIVLACEPQWLGKKIEMEADLPEVRISADADLLSQVWINLLGNSIKFTPEGGRISVELAEREEKAVVRIADNGCGIAPADREHIFERFYKADKSRNRLAGGSGLGLAIVKKIVDMHQGAIGVESETGQGTVFTISLPVRSHPPAD